MTVFYYLACIGSLANQSEIQLGLDFNHMLNKPSVRNLSCIWIWSLNGCFPYSSFHYNLFGYTKVVTILYDWLRFSLVTRVLPVPLHRPPASGSISRAKVSFTRDLRQVSTNVRLCLQHLQGQDHKIRNFFSKCSDIRVWNFFPLALFAQALWYQPLRRGPLPSVEWISLDAW